MNLAGSMLVDNELPSHVEACVFVILEQHLHVDLSVEMGTCYKSVGKMSACRV